MLTFLLGTALGLSGALQGEGLPDILWSEDLEGTLARAKAGRKPTIVAFVASWCPLCRRFKAETLPSPELRKHADRFLWVMVDIERNLSIAKAYGVRGTPRVDVLGPDGATALRIHGALPPEPFVAQLEGYLKRDAADKGKPLDVDADDVTILTLTPEGYRSAGICFANVGYGPLRLPSLSPFQSLRYGLQPRTPSTLGQGKMEIFFSESWANLWALNEGDYKVDGEILQTAFSFSYGITDVLEMEVGFVGRSRFGGVMDGFVQGFHDLFNIDQGGRDEVPKGDFSAQIQHPGGGVSELDNDDRGPYTDALVFTLQHNITCGTDDFPAIAYAATVRTELAHMDDFDKDQVLDLALSVSVSKRLGDVYVYLGLGFAWYGDEVFLGIDLRSTQLSGLVCVEWQFVPGISAIVQYLLSQGVAENLGAFSDPSHEISFGGKIEVAPLAVLEIGLIENVITSDNSPDFGVHVGLRVRF